MNNDKAVRTTTADVDWSNLPIDMWKEEIFGFLDAKDLLYLSSTNKRFSWLCNDRKIWENFCSFYRNKPDIIAWKCFYYQFARCFMDISFFEGHDFTILKNGSGLLYSVGHNDHGQLGHSNKKHSVDFKQISFPCRIIQVSVGSRHCLALGEDFSCWSWGSNAEKQLGLGEESPKEVCSPRLITTLEGQGVVQLSCRRFDSFALTSMGEVWEWGWGIMEIVSSPRINPSFQNKNIIQLYSGDEHTLALNDKGQLYSFGKNKYGQLGNGKRDTDHHNEPFLIESLPLVKQILCYETFNLLLTESGQCHFWGDPLCPSLVSPISIKSLEEFNLKQLNMTHPGRCFALLKDGKIMKWDIEKVNEAKEVDKYVLGQSIVSLQGKFIVCKSGDCYAFGANAFGQLGIGSLNSRMIEWPGELVKLPF